MCVCVCVGGGYEEGNSRSDAAVRRETETERREKQTERQRREKRTERRDKERQTEGKERDREERKRRHTHRHGWKGSGGRKRDRQADIQNRQICGRF